ncbi:hypothetical protein [Schleiferilactobacillus harbinensis]|uniref:hypothetical protein n=1 Tax=Schleiferilactobacillus harbinensis TaxID=304207 RepID=UPI0039E9C1AD
MIVELQPVATTRYDAVLKKVGKRLAEQQVIASPDLFLAGVAAWPGKNKTLAKQGIRVLCFDPPTSDDPRVVTAPLINEQSFQRADQLPLWLVIVFIGPNTHNQPEFIQLLRILADPQACRELHQLPVSLLSGAIRRLLILEN